MRAMKKPRPGRAGAWGGAADGKRWRFWGLGGVVKGNLGISHPPVSAKPSGGSHGLLRLIGVTLAGLGLKRRQVPLDRLL